MRTIVGVTSGIGATDPRACAMIAGFALCTSAAANWRRAFSWRCEPPPARCVGTLAMHSRLALGTTASAMNRVLADVSGVVGAAARLRRAT